MMDCVIRQHEERRQMATDTMLGDMVKDDGEDILDVLLRLGKEEDHDVPLTRENIKNLLLVSCYSSLFMLKFMGTFRFFCLKFFSTFSLGTFRYCLS